MQQNHKRVAKVSDLSYADKFKIMDREAKATLILAIVIAAFFWGAIFIFKDSSATIFSIPLWFVISCIGGYLLSVIGVIFLVRKVLVDFPLDEKDIEEAENKVEETNMGASADERI